MFASSFSIHLVAPLAALACASLAPAQCVPSQGAFSGTPLAFSLQDDPVAGLAGSTVYDKAPGFVRTPPPRWAPLRGRPDFRFELVFTGCGGGTGPMPDVDATSIGEDWVIADQNGQAVVPQNRWAALTFSVTAGSNGARESTINREKNSPDGAGGDLFSYMLPGSGLPPEVVGVVDRGLDRGELGFAQEGDIDAMDVFMGLHRGSTMIRSGLPNPVRWYFSVSRDSLALVPAIWWSGSPPSGATIFVTAWNVSTQSWTCPRIWRNYDEIGLAQDEEVDAIAVDLRNGLLLFSTKTPGRDQLLVLNFGNDSVNATTYAGDDGVPISRKVGVLEADDVDAICAIDPSIRADQGRPLNSAFFAMGVPVAKHFQFPGRADGSAFRRTGNSGDEQYETFVTGWTEGGPAPGIALLTISPANQPNVLVTFGSLRRAAMPFFCGDPRRINVPIPGALAFSGAPVELRWYLIDETLTEITEAWPVLVRL